MNLQQSTPFPTAIAAAVLLLALSSWSGFAEGADAVHEPVTLRLEVDRDRVYAGESVQVTVSLAADGVKVRNVAYPRLPAVNGRQLSFVPLYEEAETNDNSARYRFSATFAPQAPGELRIGPAEISLELLEQAGGAAAFFGGVEAKPVAVKSAAILLIVLPLPAAGRPQSFNGATGDFKMTVDQLQPGIHSGSPMTINTRIKGNGDLSTAGCPSLESPLVKSYPPLPYRTAGSLRCEQVIIPLAAGLLPPLQWSYFNPQQQRYITLSASLPMVTALHNRSTAKSAVATQRVPAVPQSREEAKLNRPLTLSTVMLLLTGGTALILRQRKKLSPVATLPATRLPDISSQLLEMENVHDCAEVGKVYTLLYTILQQISAARTGLPVQGICRLDVPPTQNDFVYQQIVQLFMRCDLVRYGNYVPSPQEVKGDITLLIATVSSLKP